MKTIKIAAQVYEVRPQGATELCEGCAFRGKSCWSNTEITRAEHLAGTNCVDDCAVYVEVPA